MSTSRAGHGGVLLSAEEWVKAEVSFTGWEPVDVVDEEEEEAQETEKMEGSEEVNVHVACNGSVDNADALSDHSKPLPKSYGDCRDGARKIEQDTEMNKEHEEKGDQTHSKMISVSAMETNKSHMKGGKEEKKQGLHEKLQSSDSSHSSDSSDSESESSDSDSSSSGDSDSGSGYSSVIPYSSKKNKGKEHKKGKKSKKEKHNKKESVATKLGMILDEITHATRISRRVNKKKKKEKERNKSDNCSSDSSDSDDSDSTQSDIRGRWYESSKGRAKKKENEQMKKDKVRKAMRPKEKDSVTLGNIHLDDIHATKVEGKKQKLHENLLYDSSSDSNSSDSKSESSDDSDSNSSNSNPNSSGSDLSSGSSSQHKSYQRRPKKEGKASVEKVVRKMSGVLNDKLIFSYDSSEGDSNSDSSSILATKGIVQEFMNKGKKKQANRDKKEKATRQKKKKERGNILELKREKKQKKKEKKKKDKGRKKKGNINDVYGLQNIHIKWARDAREMEKSKKGKSYTLLEKLRRGINNSSFKLESTIDEALLHYDFESKALILTLLIALIMSQQVMVLKEKEEHIKKKWNELKKKLKKQKKKLGGIRKEKAESNTTLNKTRTGS